MKPVSIVIPTWNGLHLLRESLPSVERAARRYRRDSGAEVEIVVVEDGGSDETCRLLPREFPEVRLVRRDGNGGFSLACNTGFEAARHSIIALLNNDVRVREDYLQHKAVHFQDEDVFAVTARVFDWDGSLFSAGGRVGRFRRGFWSVYFNYDVDAECDWIDQRKLKSVYAVGGFATYSRDKLHELGGFIPFFSPFHWEDVDLSYRGWKRGWEVRYEPRAVAFHRTSATIDSHFRKSRVEETSLRNRLLFHWINLHSASFLLRHLLMLVVLFKTRFLVGDLGFYRSLRQAISLLPQARQWRSRERRAARRSDVEVARLLAAFYQSAPLQIYYNQQDVILRHPESSSREKGPKP